MPLSSASTDAQVWAAYDDNASYQEDASVTKCKAFITACVIILRRNPRRIGTREEDTELNADGIRDELRAARDWLEANDPAGGGVDDPSGSGVSASVTNRRTTRLNFNEFGG